MIEKFCEWLLNKLGFDTPQVGETWISIDSYDPNPFKREIVKVKVLDIKEGYVLYQHFNDTGVLWKNSCSIEAFRTSLLKDNVDNVQETSNAAD